jgi:1,4-dihydroxy-2-naphthoate octaprenyltransferase
VWIRELRVPFLLLPVVFVPVGIAIAWSAGHFNPFTALLTLVGAVCLHASANVLNDYFDFRSGIDLATTPTPFSGGSTILPRGLMSTRRVLYLGSLLLAAGLCIGSYFVYEFSFDRVLIAILVFTALSIVTYSLLMSKLGIGEIIIGLNFGPLLLLGTYYVQVHQLSVVPVIIGLPLGIMTAGILYVNEFPDTDADMSAGRNHLVARWGKAKAASRLKAILVCAYAIPVAGVLAGAVSPFALVALASVPKALATSKTVSKNYDKVAELIPGMASMVMTTLLTGVLLFGAYLAAGLA